MIRYATIPKAKPPRADWYDDEPMRHMPIVEDSCAVDTGLLNAEGDSIYRMPNPLGFLWEPLTTTAKGECA